MSARFSAMKGRAGRFDEPAARYLLRAFVRLHCERGGPPRTVWSDDSEPFTIAAWYEGAGAPPVQIPLPDASDRNLLRQLKPNVAFIVPPSMQNLLSGKTKDLMEGKGGLGQAGLSWICGFNIPVITICAFIVLNIFLTLFNLAGRCCRCPMPTVSFSGPTWRAACVMRSASSSAPARVSS
jgi:hypothetical protein